MVVKRFCDACGKDIPPETRYYTLDMCERDRGYKILGGEEVELEICEECGKKVRTALGLENDRILMRKEIE